MADSGILFPLILGVTMQQSVTELHVPPPHSCNSLLVLAEQSALARKLCTSMVYG